jgi:hypothetical protein
MAREALAELQAAGTATKATIATEGGLLSLRSLKSQPEIPDLRCQTARLQPAEPSQDRVVRQAAHARIQAACRAVPSITAEEFAALCSPEDLADIAAGDLSAALITAYARSFAEGIASGRLAVLGAGTSKP